MEYICEICNYKTDRSHNLKLHNTSVKHLKKSGLIEYKKHKNQININEKSMNSLIFIDQEETVIIDQQIIKNKEEIQTGKNICARKNIEIVRNVKISSDIGNHYLTNLY